MQQGLGSSETKSAHGKGARGVVDDVFVKCPLYREIIWEIQGKRPKSQFSTD